MILEHDRRIEVFNTADSFILMAITFLAFSTRLWRIHFPEEIVFDEVYFGNFTNFYLKRTYFFDIHPPLGKLIMAGIAYVSQYPGNILFSGKTEGVYLDNETSYVTLRMTPAFFQSLCFPLIYATMKILDFNKMTAVIATTSLMFETSMLTEGIFILSDGLLHFFVCLHIFCLSCFLRSPTSIRLLITGLSLGGAISCKNTALGLVILNFIYQVHWILTYLPPITEIIYRAFTYFWTVSIIFVGSFIIHFGVLKYHGMGEEVIDKVYRDTLLLNTSYGGLRNSGPYLLSKIFNLNLVMHLSNMRISKPHPYESSPLYWPLLKDKWIVFWSKKDNNLVLCLGNPVVFWITTLFIILVPFAQVMNHIDSRNIFLFLGWALSYFPFFLIPRSLYLYHYIIPMIFAVMNMAAFIDTYFSKKIRPYIQLILMASIVISFIYYSSAVYGYECNNFMSKYFILKEWENGQEKPVEPVIPPNTTVQYATLLP